MSEGGTDFLQAQINRLTEQVARLGAELAEANHRLDRFHESDLSLGAELAEALLRAEQAERELATVKNQLQGANNAAWLSYVHMLCTDCGIPQGHIDYRTHALFNKVHEMMLELSRYRQGVEVEARLIVDENEVQLTNDVRDWPVGHGFDIGEQVRVLVMADESAVKEDGE